MTEPGARQTLLERCVEEFARTLPGIGRGRSGAIHRARVVIRRLRELLPLLGLDGRMATRMSSRLKRVAADLGPVRERDVMLALIAERRRKARWAPDAMEQLERAVEQDRSRLAEQLQTRSAVAGRERLAGTLARLTGTVRDPSGARGVSAWRWAMDARVAKRAAALQSAMDEAGVIYVAAALHRVRIAVKKLRYAIELRNGATGCGENRRARVLKSAQQTLGRLHDLEGLMARIRVEQARLESGDDPVWLAWDQVAASLERAARALHGAYLRDRRSLRKVCDSLAPSARAGRVAKAG